MTHQFLVHVIFSECMLPINKHYDWSAGLQSPKNMYSKTQIHVLHPLNFSMNISYYRLMQVE